jgi:hypothetical protein
MAAWDKVVLGEKLVELGWTEIRKDGLALFVPPESLWQQRPPAFRVYEAIDLQNLLGEEPITRE